MSSQEAALRYYGCHKRQPRFLQMDYHIHSKHTTLRTLYNLTGVDQVRLTQRRKLV